MIQVLGPPPTDTPLPEVPQESLPWALWLNLIHQILENVGPRWTKVADVTFPPCPPQGSIDVDVAFPAGILPATLSGDMTPIVVLGLSSNTKATANNGFFGFVSAPDVVTIREFCCDAFGIGGFTDTFTITVLTGAPNVL